MSALDKINALRKELSEASDSYYNHGIFLMSDFEYDKKFDELKELEEVYVPEKDRFTGKVGSQTRTKLSKITHEYEAKSLGKTKDIDELIGVHNDTNHSNVCVSWKLDGCTVQLTYENGKLSLAGTRGDGLVGQDITKNSRFIDGILQEIPYKGKLVVRGEAIMSYAEFDRLNSLSDESTFANPRNLANATITAEDESLLKNRMVEFRAFELVYKDDLQDIPSFANRLDYLQNEGFKVVEHKKVSVFDLKKTIKEWSGENRIKSLGVPVDGLVIVNDDCEFTKTLKGTDHHPHLMKGMAFKWQDETVETTLRDIKWQIGRTGALTPVAIFDTVDLQGTKVTKASLHNLSYIMNKDLRIGDKISVYKANMIIPQVAENLSANVSRSHNDSANYNLPKECPCCKKSVHKNTNKDIITLSCENDDCPAKEIGKLTHFVSKHGMNIEGLSESTITILVEKGFIKEPADIYYLKDHYEELITLDGFGKKSVDNLLSAIEKSRDTDFEHFMYACGIEGFGRGQIKALKKYLEENYDTVLKEYQDTYEVYDLLGMLSNMGLSKYDFTMIDGIGDVLSKTLTDWIMDNLDYYMDGKVIHVLDELRFYDKPLQKSASKNVLGGKTFCITGSLNTFTNRDEAFDYIVVNGGKTASGVSSKTSYLVNNDISSTSGKNKKAKELGIPIITENQLREAVENGIELPGPSKKQLERD